ncbi:unnamed protein product [Rangifer tarandus platyrhynchus]|uniref:Uncharacterized protein n=1 Tax=Rangifer tarandus platyrhynchus TaxID=3082113 RepID=A0AC59ZNU9_RANTA
MVVLGKQNSPGETATIRGINGEGVRRQNENARLLFMPNQDRCCREQVGAPAGRTRREEPVLSASRSPCMLMRGRPERDS